MAAGCSEGSAAAAFSSSTGELPGPFQLAAADPRQQRAQAERQRQAADRDLALAVGEPLAAGFEPADRGGRLFAAHGGAAEFLGDQASPGGGAFGARGEQPAALGPFRDTAAQPLHRTGGAAQPGAETVELAEAVRSPGGELRSQRAQGRGAAGDRAGADHRPHPRLGGDPPLPAREQGEVALGS